MSKNEFVAGQGGTDPFEVPMCEADAVMEIAQTLGCPMQLFAAFQ